MKIKLKKMRNLYHTTFGLRDFPLGYTLPPGHTMTAAPSNLIVVANTPEEVNRIVEDSLKMGDSRVGLNLNLKVNKIGLTNKKKGVMFSWLG